MSSVLIFRVSRCTHRNVIVCNSDHIVLTAQEIYFVQNIYRLHRLLPFPRPPVTTSVRSLVVAGICSLTLATPSILPPSSTT